MTADKLYQVYVIQNPAGKFYIGLSEDVTKRRHGNWKIC
jgi:predicted GIY-YIG superfamily endonuclease